MYKPTPADKELFARAKQACEAYYAMYGRYPEKISLHHWRYSRFYYRQINLIERLNISLTVTFTAELSEPIPAARHVCVPFAPMAGEHINLNEVYLPHPLHENAVISFLDLEKLLAVKEH